MSVLAPTLARPTAGKPLTRYAQTTPALRQRELDWWAKYGESEERYFWGVTHSWQPLARLRYIDRMAALFADCAHVVDYGCGSGWLARALADRMQRPVTGVDFSAAQIALASESNADCPWTLFATITGPADLPPAPGYVFHGLLHHLSEQEIHDLLARVTALAPRGARVVFVEPVCYPGQVPDVRDTVLLQAIDELVNEPWRIAEARGLPVTEAVRAARDERDGRWWGDAPHGPSPMEKPFEHRELDELLGRYFAVESSTPVQYLPASQGLAVELAMLRDCDADLADQLAGELMPQVDALERVLLRLPRLPDTGWYMRLVEARVR